MAMAENPEMCWWDAPSKHHHPRKWKGIDRYNKNMCKGVKTGSQVVGGYDPPRLKDLKKQNRLRTRKFYNQRRVVVPRTVPRAPFNDSTFLMRVRRSGGLASVVSPSVLSSPTVCSSYKCEQNDYGYGSMTGLIHLRPVEDQSIGSTVNNNNGSAFDDTWLEQQQQQQQQQQNPKPDSVQEFEQRLDRFEMTPLPDRISEEVMEQRVTRQDIHIAHLEDENLVLKERLFLIQQEVDELRQRLQGGERSCNDILDDESHDDIDDTQSYFAR